MKVISRLAPVGLIAALITLAVTGTLIARSPVFFLLQVAGLALNLWARASFPSRTFRVGPAPAGETFMRRGPYRFVRHPMYAAALLFFWAAIADHPTPLNLGIGVALTLLVRVRVHEEDRLLAARFGDYADYARTTKAFVPRLI
jgi:protein-S-isoprenylcysteine O-methyltransferase Ste14